ncbi:hypothetical protein SAMN05444401_2366 [Clostridium amylolyticum]|uniref:Uncharacterized protein n=2 Tax=Clostridium amylolyticum TaxID=1121298 RepID=A0A1M6H4K6_9CLOT|nr:hypothetical protein SAMN05444401_2366 [Clostridium amylolyticum]
MPGIMQKRPWIKGIQEEDTKTARRIISKSLNVKEFMDVRKYIWKAPNDARNSRLWNAFLWRLCCRISCNTGISKIARGFCQIENDIARECSKAIILPGLAVNGAVASEEVAK